MFDPFRYAVSFLILSCSPEVFRFRCCTRRLRTCATTSTTYVCRNLEVRANEKYRVFGRCTGVSVEYRILSRGSKRVLSNEAPALSCIQRHCDGTYVLVLAYVPQSGQVFCWRKTQMCPSIWSKIKKTLQRVSFRRLTVIWRKVLQKLNHSTKAHFAPAKFFSRLTPDNFVGRPWWPQV